MKDTFLWFDLETFGRSPRTSRIAQFAGIRTDAGLEIIDDPLMFYCQPALDLLPSPEATLITGITPQRARSEGLIEPEFLARVHEALAQPGTCAVGYNSLRFDDEHIRHALYRNFFDPYQREYARGNSRWDLLDLGRLLYALRPEGIEWPRREDGLPSFKLEHLAAANGCGHSRAHDALSDVEALIDLARVFRRAQPRMWDYYFEFRRKQRALALLDVASMTPVLHVSGMFSAEHGCAAIVAPIAEHPVVPGRVIVFDLGSDPGDLLRLQPDEIADRLYVARADLPEGEQRVALKEIHCNRCPALVDMRHISDSELARLKLDRNLALQRLEQMRTSAGLASKVRAVFARPRAFVSGGDADGALYDGFLPDADRAQFEALRRSRPEQLADFEQRLRDPRLKVILQRYRARNWPQTLSLQEQEQWREYLQQRLAPGSELSEYDMETYPPLLDALRVQHAADAQALALLNALGDWQREISLQL
ncbi:MAG: exodeoxyribonuclease I [Aquimonas sp.]|nr:exodeoxyribonuclease I [Aquimonas sp.]